MDACESTNVLISKIKKIDPENASKIMGYILLQALSDADLASLASSHDTLLRNVVLTAKVHLGISTTSSYASPTNSYPPSPLNPISRPRNPFSTTSLRVTGNGPFDEFARNRSPLSWPFRELVSDVGSGSDASFSPKSNTLLLYDNVRTNATLVPPQMRNGGDSGTNMGDLVDEYLSFMEDSSSRSEEPLDPSGQLGGLSMDNGNGRFYRRSFSESCACLGFEDGGFGAGYRPCTYYARGFCKNGDSCKFVHCGFEDDDVLDGVAAGGTLLGSPREMEGLHFPQHEDMIKMKAAQQQQHRRLACDKYMNLLLRHRDDSPRLSRAADIIGDEFHKYNRFRLERNDRFSLSMTDKSCSADRQIYLTFPADSTFRDEHVSNYFSTFGPVQDVRIPYQQKRMFGFVSFVHPETVQLILTRGNPHFICDSRVLVKPYKEKGKRQHHLQQQLLEMGNFSPFSSLSGMEPRDRYDLHLEAKMIQDAQDMLLRRKLEEQAELQQAIELQGRRLVNLQLPGLTHDHARLHQRSLSVGSQNPMHTRTFMSHNVCNDDGTSSAVAVSASVTNGANQDLQPEGAANCNQKSGAVGGKVDGYYSQIRCAQECHVPNKEHALPDNLPSSPKSAVKQHLDLSAQSAEVKTLPASPLISSSEVTAVPAGNEASS